MGNAFLTEAATDKDSGTVESDKFECGYSAMQGWRLSMEDAHRIELDLAGDGVSSYFGVFDGHGGKQVARACAERLHTFILGSRGWSRGNIDEALVEGFLAMDEFLRRPEGTSILESYWEPAQTDNNNNNGDDEQVPVIAVQATTPATREEDSGVVQYKLLMPGPGEDFDAEAPGTAAGKRKREDDNGEPADEAVDKPDGAKTIELEVDLDALEDIDAEERPTEQKKIKSGDSDGAEADNAGADPVALPRIRLNLQNSARRRGSTGNEERAAYGCGATAVAAIVVNNILFVGNAGDSRCVLSRNGVAVDMSEDHAPTLTAERNRITKAGHCVMRGRIDSSLNLSRAIGDFQFKDAAHLPPEEQAVTANPEVRKQMLQPDDEFLVLACDGIWNSMTSQEVVDFARKALFVEKEPVRTVCEQLCDKCMAPDKASSNGNGLDNETIMIIVFKGLSPAPST